MPRSCLARLKYITYAPSTRLVLLLMQDEQMIETLTSNTPQHTTQEALTDGIGSRSSIRSFEHLDVTGLGHPIEGHPKLAIVLTDELLRSHPIGCGFSKRHVPSTRRWEIVDQKHQEHAIRFGTGGSFHLSPQDDQRLSKERIFCDQFGPATGLVCQCAKQERGGVRFGPGDVAVME